MTADFKGKLNSGPKKKKFQGFFFVLHPLALGEGSAPGRTQTHLSQQTKHTAPTSTLGMGISSSSLPPPPIDLLPPRFPYFLSRQHDPSTTPISAGGLSEFRSALFSQPFAPLGASLTARLAADSNGTSDVAITVSSGTTYRAPNFTAAAHARSKSKSDDDDDHYGLLSGSAALDVDGNTRALISNTIERRRREESGDEDKKALSSSAASDTFSTWALFSTGSGGSGGSRMRQSLGEGFHGPPRPATSLLHSRYNGTNGTTAAASLPVINDNSSSSIELGTRIRAFGGKFEGGIMGDILPPFPTAAWILTRQHTESSSHSTSSASSTTTTSSFPTETQKNPILTTAAQVNVSDIRLIAPLSPSPSSSSSSSRLITSLSTSNTMKNKSPITFDAIATLSRLSPPSELSLAFNGKSQSVIAAYTTSFAIRRNVYNPLAPSHILGIWQHVDIAIEAKRALSNISPSPSPSPSINSGNTNSGSGNGGGGAALGGAVALQLNRMTRIATRIEASRFGAKAAVSLSLRTWSDPAALLTGTLHFDALRGLGTGISLDISHAPRDDLEKKIVTNYGGGKSSRNSIPHIPSLSLPATPPINIAGTKESAAKAN